MLLLLCLMLIAVPAFAKPIAAADVGGVIVTLTDEPCAVKEVSNLPHRATWAQGSKVFEGCWGVKHGAVVSYWREDRTVAVLPAQAFRALTTL